MAEQGILPILDGPALVAGLFELSGEPRHKARHRSRIGYKDGKPFVMQYPDPDTAKYEAVLGQAASLFMRGKKPTDKPVALLVHVFKSVPKSWTEKKRQAALAGAILPDGKADWDNFGKVVSDGMNKIVYLDDSQVVDGRVIKRYDAKPGLRIEVREFVLST
jgi:Holliday junction resolvase RusA-like endonuclease